MEKPKDAVVFHSMFGWLNQKQVDYLRKMEKGAGEGSGGGHGGGGGGPYKHSIPGEGGGYVGCNCKQNEYIPPRSISGVQYTMLEGDFSFASATGGGGGGSNVPCKTAGANDASGHLGFGDYDIDG